nr:MAG TPA: hypothetical protein [Caudoviricetes sp.]
MEAIKNRTRRGKKQSNKYYFGFYLRLFFC